MPIRMKKDKPGNHQRKLRTRNQSNRSSGSSNGGGLGSIISIVLPFLLKKPKLLIPIIIIGGLYLFFGKGCFSSENTEQSNSNTTNLFNTGGVFDKEVYESTEIYEPLADNIKNPLPEQVSLLKYAPKRLNQGQQGSCVAWASAYAARTILEAQRTGQSPNAVAFSPSFMYNQISLNKRTCQGSYIKLAMDNMMGIGAVPFNAFKYDDKSCSKTPSRQLKTEAEAYKINGFQRLTEEDNKYAVREMLSIKQNLAKGSPVIIGMMVGGSFMRSMNNVAVWVPTNTDYAQKGFGGHAMCIIGYDDYKDGGAFQIMNSWGTDWGVDGIAWVRYTDFKAFNIESYGVYPMGNSEDKDEPLFKGSFSLELNKGNKNVELNNISQGYYETSTKLKADDEFKLEFTNNVECYTYIFGEETDGSSYVLFPYTKKHSPYCGITGTRLFPRDYSMIPDEKGNVDKIAIVITKKPLDYIDLNNKISNNNGSSYQEKLTNVLGYQLGNMNSEASGNLIHFSTSSANKNDLAFVIGINK